MSLACTPVWEDREKDAFKAFCLNGVASTTEVEPAGLCDCLLTKAQEKYPNPEDVQEMTTNRDLFFAMVKQCETVKSYDVPAVWSESSQRGFLGSCRSLGRKGYLDSAQCPCALEKVMKRYTTLNQVNKLDSNVVVKLTQECGQ